MAHPVLALVESDMKTENITGHLSSQPLLCLGCEVSFVLLNAVVFRSNPSGEESELLGAGQPIFQISSMLSFFQKNLKVSEVILFSCFSQVHFHFVELRELENIMRELRELELMTLGWGG